MDPFPEVDWKPFRKVREIALQRFCENVLTEVDAASGSDGSFHDRYVQIYDLIQKRNDELADLFDSPSRSQAFIQLVGMRFRNLLTEDEYLKFSEATRKRIERYLELLQPYEQTEPSEPFELG
jgi:hypothetical protein